MKCWASVVLDYSQDSLHVNKTIIMFMNELHDTDFRQNLYFCNFLTKSIFYKGFELQEIIGNYLLNWMEQEYKLLRET